MTELSTMYKEPTSTEDFMTIGYDKAIADVVVTAHRQPTVDAVEVVRCRECEFRYEGEYRGRRVMMCDYMDPEPEDKMSDDDFCSRGRKNDAEGCFY